MDTRNTQFREEQSESLKQNSSSHTARIRNFLITLAVVGILYAGWAGRDNTYISAAEGFGYWLGIIGGAAMLLLMTYPMRKSMRSMQTWGPIKYWFLVHMILGVTGPVLVLFHANFSLGSTNSNLAMFSMLTVATSGLIGRLLYKKVHFGLHGQKASLKDLREDFQLTKGSLGAHISLSGRVVKLIKKYERFMLKKRNFVVHLVSLPVLYFRTKYLSYYIKRAVIRDLKKQAKANDWGRAMLNDFTKQARLYLGDYFLCLRKISQLSTYHRLFSFWHILHMPLFIILVLTGVIHVIAVHMYS